MKKPLIVALTIVMMLASVVSAQQSPPTLKPNVSPSSPETIPALAPKPPVEFNSWLKSTRERYAEWLARYEQ